MLSNKIEKKSIKKIDSKQIKSNKRMSITIEIKLKWKNNF